MLPDEADMLSRMWFPVARVQDLDRGPFGATLLGRRLVVYRSGGEIAVADDRCSHRGGRLSKGRTVDAVLTSSLPPIRRMTTSSNDGSAGGTSLARYGGKRRSTSACR